IPTLYTEPVSVYLNGSYHGYYMLVENVDESFFRRRGMQISSLYKARRVSAFMSLESLINIEKGVSEQYGESRYADLRNLIISVQQAPEEDLPKVAERWMQLDEFAVYLGTALYLRHFDSANNNFYLYRLKGKQQFGIVPWDLDRLFD